MGCKPDIASALVLQRVQADRDNILQELETLQVRLVNLIHQNRIPTSTQAMQRSLRFVEEAQTCFVGVVRANARPDLLWLACMEVEKQLRRLGSSVGRSLVVLHGLRLVAEREERDARRRSKVFSLEFFATGRHELSPVGGS